MAIKGYVVRWTDSWFGAPKEARYDGLSAAVWCRLDREQRGNAKDATLYRVHDDGREERLPSYEEALALLGADPLAALEAAERRLLEAGGWTAVPDEDYRGYWRDRDGRMCKQAVAILAEKRRLAAKGGA